MPSTANHLLTPQQWREVFEAIRTSGRSVSEFQGLARPTKFGRGYEVSQVFHWPTAYYFLFDCDPEGAGYSKYALGPDGAVNSEFTSDWPERMKALRRWLGSLPKE